MLHCVAQLVLYFIHIYSFYIAESFYTYIGMITASQCGRSLSADLVVMMLIMMVVMIVERMRYFVHNSMMVMFVMMFVMMRFMMWLMMWFMMVFIMDNHLKWAEFTPM